MLSNLNTDSCNENIIMKPMTAASDAIALHPPLIKACGNDILFQPTMTYACTG